MFLENFFANLFSDLIAGGIIGTILGWYLGRTLQWEERDQQQKDALISDKQKAVQYLKLLRDEIADLKDRLPKELTDFNETGWGREIRIESPFWETVDKGGELPKLLHPNMVKYITQFYGHVELARRGRDLLIESWLISNPQAVPGIKMKQSTFMEITTSNLQEAIREAPNLLNHIDDNVSALKEQIRILEKDSN